MLMSLLIINNHYWELFYVQYHAITPDHQAEFKECKSLLAYLGMVQKGH